MVGPPTPPAPFLYPVLVFPMFSPNPTPCPQSSLPRRQLATVLLQVFLPRSPPSQVPGLVPHLSQAQAIQAHVGNQTPRLPILPLFCVRLSAAALFFPLRSDHVTLAPVPSCLPNKVVTSLPDTQGPLRVTQSVSPALPPVTSPYVSVCRPNRVAHPYLNILCDPSFHAVLTPFLLPRIPSPALYLRKSCRALLLSAFS